jgi:hypothetical protein
MWLIFKIQQKTFTFVNNKNHITTIAAIAAHRTALGHVFLTSPNDHTIPAVPRSGFNHHFVNECRTAHGEPLVGVIAPISMANKMFAQNTNADREKSSGSTFDSFATESVQ